MNLRQRLLKYLLLAMAAFPLSSCSNEYSAKTIEAWVIDAETQQPIEGVNVVAHWELNYGLEGGGAYELTVMETVSDKNGRFSFPAWGPKEIPSSLPREARMKEFDPQIWLFKAGFDNIYRTKKVDRRIPTDFSGHGPSVREWYANGDRIELRKIKDISPQARAYMGGDKATDAEIAANRLAVLDDDLRRLAPRTGCGWRDVAQAIISAEKARRDLLTAHEADLRKGFLHQRTLYGDLVANDANLTLLCGESPKKSLQIVQ